LLFLSQMECVLAGVKGAALRRPADIFSALYKVF